MLQKMLLIAFAGGLGTLARYGISSVAQQAHNSAFPWGTALVNLAGCFIFGLLWSLTESRLTLSVETRAIVLVGFMGAFTTFSTFVFETGQSLRDSQWFLALGNVAFQNLVGLSAFFAGLLAGR